MQILKYDNSVSPSQNHLPNLGLPVASLHASQSFLSTMWGCGGVFRAGKGTPVLAAGMLGGAGPGETLCWQTTTTVDILSSTLCVSTVVA